LSKPPQRGTAPAIVRELTVAPESLSAQLADLLAAVLPPQGRCPPRISARQRDPGSLKSAAAGSSAAGTAGCLLPIGDVLGEDHHPGTLVTASTGG
jgi:hypothetical protein